ncbi:MAG: hypothetical protein AB9882_00150 [Ignavibacteriaceae bacterium]
MSKIIFSMQYEIKAEEKEEYIESLKELKMLQKSEGVENYSVYEVKGRTNVFEEVIIFSSEEAFDNYDDASNERIELLNSKIEELKVPRTTKYNTLIELSI